MPEQEPDWCVLRRRAIGERIRTARRFRKLTQEQLAHLIGVDRRTIHRYETALRDAPLSVLVLIADALEMQLALLVDMSLELDMRGSQRDQRPT
ncbi:helix-turn-helix domain-containing protein [Streptomyces griseorubiginosus]|uniref:helix-turn-helix domain-containing protein n=1 Tax=Streptomyces griseorubiginosus TaxID=67304 RepID=UPI00364030F7